MNIAGIDIGTTTISIVVLDSESGMLAGKKTMEHNSFMSGEFAESRIQDPERIWSMTEEALRELSDLCGGLGGIGVTGQMHGMLYTDRDGRAVSPLYTWQDGCGERPLPGGYSSVRYLKEHAGASAAGYGLATHYFLQQTGKIPASAAAMTPVGDYIVMRLCGRTKPVIAADMAASWGCFDLEKECFLTERLEKAEVDISYLPPVLRSHSVVGETREGIPVICSLGDNQASVLGSVRDPRKTALINVGTGSQISMGTTDYFPCSGSLEIRPCTPEYRIMAGSSLCGGRAYAMLEQFYRAVPGAEADDLYDRMMRQAQDFLEAHGKDAAWKIVPAFSGTRSDPKEQGRMTGIHVSNFHPGAMTSGMLLGILGELHGYYEDMCRMTGKKAEEMVGSGNGLRKNPLMRRLAEEMFEMPMKIPAYEEEAACGAALCAMAGIGLTSSLEEAQQKIRYIE